MWRFETLLPVEREFGSYLAIGGTPLYDVGCHHGIDLYFKDETRNPSGSLKDRATELVLAIAKKNGIEHVVTASTGNAAASLACLAAAQKMKATIVVPKKTPPAKLSQVRAFEAELILVDGDYDAACQHAIEVAAHTGAYCRSTGLNPFTREGKKTVAFEIAEQFGWAVPDWIFVAGGDGNIVSSIGKGFDELLMIGAIEHTPRIACAQALSSNSIARGFTQSLRDGKTPPAPIASPFTRADSISVSEPKDYLAAVKALVKSNGAICELTEEEIRRATGELAKRFGLFCEPSAAAAFGALTKLAECGTVAVGSKVVVIATGTGLKDPHYLFEGEIACA